ncbi:MULTISPECIES: hypothetical protein [unclassified Arthrobacter]|uniref:hypothetical protein n=1 Tax=unclassified Arthrobacter TaxID=235627 RepID=UPI0027D90B8A|nr:MULTISPECIES: hypothetical protein [unclassified Arthrobacter]
MKFVQFSIFGLILCLILMIVLAGLRSFGAVASFTAIFALILTAPTVSSQRRLTQGLTKRVNDTIVEVTSTPGAQLSVKQFRHLVKSGEPLPLPVSGVPGLSLHVERAPVVEKNAPEKWSAVFTVIPPENGTASFDRLVAAAIGPGPNTNATDLT